MIEVSHLTKNYGARRAVDDLSFSVPTGQIVGLLGPNGAGKSTTMNMLTGYLAPTSGTVSIEGHDILDDPIQARRCIGYLPEIPPLYQDMKVDEYLRFVAELRGIPRAQRAEEVATAASQAGVTDVIDRLIRNLSKGYRQRVGLAAALVGKPPFLILDEPTVGLDPKQMIEMRSLIRELGKNHTVLLSSHILSEVSAVCDHVLILSGGRLVASGTPAELEQRVSGGGQLSITVAGPLQAARSAALQVDGVLSVQAVPAAEKGQTLLTVEVPADKDLRAALSAALGLAGCPVVAMAQQRMSLEDIFLQLTENAPDTADQPDDTDDAQPAEEAEETLPDETEEPQPPQESQQEEDAQ